MRSSAPIIGTTAFPWVRFGGRLPTMMKAFLLG